MVREIQSDRIFKGWRVRYRTPTTPAGEWERSPLQKTWEHAQAAEVCVATVGQQTVKAHSVHLVRVYSRPKRLQGRTEPSTPAGITLGPNDLPAFDVTDSVPHREPD